MQSAAQLAPPNQDVPVGLYLSIPFCRSKCTYCNFASGVYPASQHGRYVERLVEDLHHSHTRAHSLGVHLPRVVDSIYFGGGTPVLLAPAHFHAIFRAIRQEFILAPDAEITVECAPAQLSDETLQALTECGVNRISLGVQSFLDRECAVSGRLHTRADVLGDLERLRKVGITNLNVDLLAGLAGQTLASWRESLDVLLETAVPHASIYMLEIDEDSRLGRELIAGGARYHAELVPSDDTIAAMYETAIEVLASAGLAQYEISNFARPGFASHHNLRYWSRLPYLGLGLDAASMLFATTPENPSPRKSLTHNPSAPRIPASLRFTQTADLADYLADAAPLTETSFAQQSWLGPVQQLEESWFLGLRRNSGIDIHDLAREFGSLTIQPSLAVAHRLVADGLLCPLPDRDAFALTPRGRLLSNDVFAEFLGLGSHHSAQES